MPIISITTSVTLNEEKLKTLHKLIVEVLAENLRKSVNNIMFMVHSPIYMSFGLEHDLETAFVDIRNIGEITSEQKEAITQNVYAVLTSTINISAKHTYLNFVDISRKDWSWDSKLLVKV